MWSEACLLETAYDGLAEAERSLFQVGDVGRSLIGRSL